MKTCRTCNAQILWATTPSGKRMPLDAVPTAAGNIWLRSDGISIVGGEGALLYTSHFATCPSAAEHRRRA